MRIKKILTGFISSLFLFLAMPLSAIAATNTTVTSVNTQGWIFNGDTSTSTPFEFNSVESSIGTGSLYVLPIGSDPSDKFIAAKPIGASTTDLNSVAYDFQITGDGTAADASQFYLNIYTNTPGSSTFYDCRFDYVPSTGSTTDFTTASFTATDTPVNVKARTGVTCPTTLSGMTAGSTVSFIAINVGDTSASDEGLAGFLDNVVITTASNPITYDFEPVIEVASKDACKNNGWKTSNTPVYKNQGECVSSFAKSKNHADIPAINSLRF